MSHPTTWTYPPGQLTGKAVTALTPEEYAQAEETGLLDKHLGRAPQPPAKGQLTRTDLNAMSPEQIDQAREQGQFDTLMHGDAAS
ncbi:hypothetical protein [Streptomyces sp. ADI98-10]|uniref:hypothetical protein n=1 Tax=Streptomyces sp. ADI98-10 TaxID=1522763 RepID=UPI000F558DFF|nr:hypothetical protein [Streptomyces sp. ADI98-10]RPK93779.1 hypothetical protein EES46_04860 [Streptomyces sp. ADI98-10]